MKKIALWQQIFIAMVLGLIVGAIAGDGTLTAGILKPVGTIFINLIKMLVVPLIFCSLLTGIVSIEGELSRMGRIFGRTLLLYLATTAVAVSIGLLIAELIAPGIGLNIAIPEIGSAPGKETGGLLVNVMNTLVGLVPANPVSSLASGKTLQIIVFAVLFGIAINLAGEKGEPVRAFFNSASEVMFRLTSMIMAIAPIGVFALMAWVAGKFGLSLLLPLIKVIIAVYVACALHAVLTIGSFAAFLGKISPLRFFKACAEPWGFAFASTSSYGTLPLTISAVTRKLGVSQRIANFVCPLGATINMDGTAIYQGVAAVFIAEVYGIDLNAMQYVIIVFTCTLASIGTAGMPGAGLILLSLVLSSAGLPLDGLAIIAGIDRILDMARTSINILGDCMCALVIGQAEKEVAPISQASA